MRQYIVHVGEPWDFKGPDDKAHFFVSLCGTVSTEPQINWQDKYLLFEVKKPFKIKNELVKQIIASPRYQGDTLQGIEENGGTVGISRVRPQKTLMNNAVFEKKDIEYCIIGTIKFVSNEKAT